MFFLPFSVYSLQFEFSKEENEIIGILKEKCDKKLDYRSFPTSFKNRIQLLHCETLRDIGETYNKENRFLISSALGSYGDYNNINSLNNEFYGDMSQEKNKTMTERGSTENIHPYDLTLSISNNTQLTISKDQKNKITKEYGVNFNYFFKETENITEDELKLLINWAFENQLYLSYEMNEVLINKIGNVLLNKYGYGEKLYEWVLKQPWNIRKNLLTLWSSIKLEQYNFLNFLRAINWSGNQIRLMYSYNLDENKNLIYLNDGSDNSYFSLLNQINNIEKGHLTSLNPITTVNLFLKNRQYKNHLKKFESEFIYTFDLIKILELKYKNKNFTIDDIKRINDPLTNKLIDAHNAYQLIYNNSLNLNKNEKFNILSKFSKSGFQIFSLLLLEANVKDYDEKKIREIIYEYENDIINQCDALKSEKCFNEWMQLTAGNIEIHQTEENCKKSWLNKNLTQKLIDNKVTSTESLLLCKNSASYKNFKFNFNEFIAFPQPFGGIRWAHSIDIYTGELGLFGLNLFNKKNEKHNFPLPINARYISEQYTSEGFVLMEKIISNNIPIDNDEFINYNTLAGFAQNVGDYHTSFKNNLLSVDKFFSEKLGVAHANLLFLGKNTGIPKNHLTEFVKEISTTPNKTEMNKIYGDRKNFLQGYISNSDLDDVIGLLGKEDKASQYFGLGAALSFTSEKKDEFCKLAHSKKLLNDDWFNQHYNKIENLWNIGRFLSYEFYNLNSICRAGKIFYEFDSLDDNEIFQLSSQVYNQFLHDILLPNLINNSNFAEPAFLDSIISFTKISAIANKPLGIAFSLNTLSAIYEKLLNSFMINDSDVLRNEQKRIESALTILAIRLKNNNIKSQSKHTNEKLNSLLLNSHNPFLSDKIRERHVSNSFYNNSDVQTNYTNFKMSLFTKRKSRAKSNSIFDYMINSAKQINGSNNIYFDYYINSYFMVSESITNSNYLNLVSTGELIYALGKDINSNIRSFSSFGKSEKNNLLAEIEAESSLSNDSIDKLCNIYSDFHSQISSFVNSSSNLTLTPSVNLFPIPFDIIIGNGCKDSKVRKDLSIILVNDFMTAIDLDLSYNNFKSPSTLVGIGNPVLNTDEFEIDLGDWRSASYMKNNTFDLEKLPPLPDAEIEIDSVKNLFDTSSTFLGPQASISKGLLKAQFNSASSKKNLIILATHGFSADVGDESKMPGLLSIENNGLSLFLANQIEEYRLEDSIVILSACDTASGFVKEADKLFTGFVKSLSNADVEFIIASLWPVNTIAARYVSEDFTKSIIKEGYFTSTIRSKTRIEQKPLILPFVFIYP